MSKSKNNNGFLSGFSKSYQKTRARILSKKNIFKNSYLNSYKNTRNSVNNGFAKNPALRPSIIVAASFILGLFIGLYVAPTYITSASTDIDLETNTVNDTKFDTVKHDEANIPTIATSRSTTSSAQATQTISTTSNVAVSVPAHLISASVKSSDGTLSVPDYGVSYYKSLYMGHTPGIFSNLKNAKSGQLVILGNDTYVIDSVQVGLPVTSAKSVSNYSISSLANRPAGEITLITCFGTSNRTLVFAHKA